MNSQQRNLQHPVWDIYDEYRTARLNVKINEYHLANYKKWNFIIEFILALTASSSVASFWFWQSATGQTVWKCLSVLTAILAVLKPMLNLSGKIQKFSEILTDFKSLEHDFHKLTILINQQQRYDPEFKDQFYYLLDQKRFINQKTNEGTIRKSKKREFEAQVINELPANIFYIPED
ncbi:MAG: hypothetical protein MUO63_11135 [Desulfobulbaceae bacterium]|nr:hypothetical protein [Desulfobulbaceae bacterium]